MGRRSRSVWELLERMTLGASPQALEFCFRCLVARDTRSLSYQETSHEGQFMEFLQIISRYHFSFGCFTAVCYVYWRSISHVASNAPCLGDLLSPSIHCGDVATVKKPTRYRSLVFSDHSLGTGPYDLVQTV